MKEYLTEQRTVLVDFLKNNITMQLSVEDIAAEICSDGKISRSAVYRNLAKLADEGIVLRIKPEDSRSTLYQYNPCNTHCEKIHLKCLNCGVISHMDNDCAAEFIENIKLKNSFIVDGHKTVIYGICDKCCQCNGYTQR